jgi:putative flippase GtrA
MKHRKRLETLIRYVLAGAAGFGLNVGFYALLLYGAHLWYILASVIAFCLATACGFFIQKLFAFREYSKHRSAGQFAAYFAFILFNLGANSLILFVLVDSLSINKLLASVCASGIVALWSFFVYEKLIFSKKAALSASAEQQPLAHARPTVSVVIPCHNEELSIRAVLSAIPKGMHEVIVVDNNCTDNTATIARALGARVVAESTPGYGSALKCGFNAATGDIIAALDGDNQYPAEAIPRIVDFLVANHLDFISGSRFPLKNPASMGAVSKVGNWGLTLITNMLFGLDLHDSQSGMWVFKRSLLKRIRLSGDDMSFSQELKLKAIACPGARFAEYHIPYAPRIGDSKLLPLRHGLLNLRDLFLVRLGMK